MSRRRNRSPCRRKSGGLALLAAPLGGEDVGIVKDTKAKTYTAVLAVRVRSFGLLDQTEQERRLAGWGSVLAGLSRESSPVRRVQWRMSAVRASKRRHATELTVGR